MAASPGPNSAPTLTTVDTTKTDIKTPKNQFVASCALPNENDSSVFGSLTSPSAGSNQAELTSSVGFDIPQWKKDLIQRRKINIAKTIAAASGNSFREDTSSVAINASISDTLSTSIDSKNCSTVTNNYNSDKTINSARTNTNDESNRSNTSHIPITSSVTKSIENMPKTPTTIQPQIKLEMLRGGHYTHFNKKSSEGFLNNHNEKSLDTSIYTIKAEHQQPQTLEQNSNPILPLPQESLRFRKNLSEQQPESPSTTSSDSFSDPSVKATAPPESYKKQNKDNNCRENSLCASDEHYSHIFQTEPALTTTNISKSNTSDKLLHDHEEDDCDDDQLQHELQFVSECDRVNLACEVKPNEFAARDIDSKVNSTKIDSKINTGYSPLHSTTVVNNKKSCGIVNSSVSPSNASASLTFKKNPHIGYVNDVTTHHNLKINSKLRSNHNSCLTTSIETTTSVVVVACNESSTKVTNNKKKMVAVQEKNDITNNELDFDPSEELQYGPGIVSKLRCRYLSLALRQTMDKQRSPIDYLRRATSLNNLLDGNNIHEDDDEDDAPDTTNKEKNNPSLVVSSSSQIKTKESSTLTKENETVVERNLDSHPKMEDSIRSYKNQHRSRHIKRGNDSLKRARSVEALLCEKSPWNFCNSQPTTVSNGASDLVTIDDKINNARERLLSGSDTSPPKRLTSIIDDTERPPPDLVKQTLKIFEASANRRPVTGLRNGSGEVATKVANYKCLMTQNKPPIAFSKPPISPKTLNQKPKPMEIKNTINSPTTSHSVVSSVQQSEKIVSQTLNGHINTKTALRQKTDSTSIRKIGCASSAVEVLSENSSDVIQSNSLLEKPVDSSSPVSEDINLIHNIESFNTTTTTTTTTTQQSNKDKVFSESSEPESDDDDDSMDGEYVINKEEPSATPQDAISKAGTSQSFTYATNTSGSSSKKIYHPSEPLHDIPTLATASSLTTTTVKQIGVIRPLLADRSQSNQIMNNFAEEISYDKSSTLTSREIEKNRINNEKKIKKDLNEVASTLKKITVSTSEDISSSPVSTGSSVLLSKKKRFGAANVPENNTMVFNFKDRKEVPDYIESDGLIFKHKRELPKPNEPGFVLLGDLSRETSTDPEDEWPMCPPSPCDVEFENANIVIDGKSNIKSRSKEANFRVQFNDTLNSTFEYPSESSMIEDTGSGYADLNSYEVEENDSPIVHHHVKSEEIIQLPQKKTILGNMPLGSAPLGCYAPLTANTDNLFQLGVTRIPSTHSHSDKNGNEKSSGELYAEHDKPLLEYLKPASDDLTIVYSEGSLKTDLLY